MFLGSVYNSRTRRHCETHRHCEQTHRHCEQTHRHCEQAHRHCERSEAIQWPYERLEKVTGLLRRYAPRNDDFTIGSQ